VGLSGAIHTYIHDIQQKKQRAKVKNEGNSGSSLGMMSATLAEAVARVDQLWETMIGG
jgi:hypothetical protein